MRKPCFRKSYLLVISIFALFCAACKKEKKTTVYNFSYSGSSYAGNPVHFTTTPSSGSTFAWDFGDKNTAAIANPDHVYSAGGIYTVALVVNGDTAHGIKKTLSIGFDSLQMASLAGTRTYHHSTTTHREIIGVGDSVTVISFADITVSITTVDPATILFGSDTLFLYSSDTGTAIFGYSYFDNTGYPASNHNNLAFYFATNKIHFYRRSQYIRNYGQEDYETP
jgi:PKD repeat protein